MTEDEVIKPWAMGVIWHLWPKTNTKWEDVQVGSPIDRQSQQNSFGIFQQESKDTCQGALYNYSLKEFLFWICWISHFWWLQYFWSTPSSSKMNLVGWRKEEEKERGKKHRHSCIPVHSRWYTWYSQVKHMFGLFLLLNPCKHTELLPISFKDFDSRFSRSTDQNSSKLIKTPRLAELPGSFPSISSLRCWLHTGTPTWSLSICSSPSSGGAGLWSCYGAWGISWR